MADERRNIIRADNAVKRMCSISDSGLVFHSTDAMQVCSEVKLTIETNILGQKNEWAVQGWVVECQPVEIEEGLGFQVTMLFSDIPQPLREMLQKSGEQKPRSYPAVPGAEMFGLN